MNAKMIVDQRELEYLLSLPVKVIEQYSSERYLADWRLKKVEVPPLPVIELGAHTRRFHVGRVMEWMERYFGNVPVEGGGA